MTPKNEPFTAQVQGTDGTRGGLDTTFELERYDADLQQRVRHAADRLEPYLGGE
jgi:hypothetical protein